MPPYQTNLDARRANLERIMKGGTSGEVATCEACGGTYFFAVNAEQYSKGYGSVEYNALNANPRPTKICLCGTPLPTKNTARGASEIRGVQEEYFRSLAAAKEYLEANSIKNLAKVAASPSELEEVRKLIADKVAELKTIIDKLPHISVVDDIATKIKAKKAVKTAPIVEETKNE